MASACVNNVTLPPDSFPLARQSSYGLHRTSISPAPADVVVANISPSAVSEAESPRISADLIDFEFRLDDPVTMLPADELFSGGKLVPLHLATLRPSAGAGKTHSTDLDEKQWCGTDDIVSNELVLSPKAPRCTTRWRELLGFKKQQNPKTFSDQSKPVGLPVAASPPSIEPMPAAKSTSSKSFKHLLLHHSKSSIDPSLSIPLLHVDPEALASSISTRLSLSSSSSGLDHEDLPRLSLDSDRARNPLRVRISRPRPGVSDDRFRTRVGRSPVRRSTEEAAPVPARGVSVDSPRMDPSGRVIFQGLERSSSSPGSFNGRPRAKYRAMERSFSAHIRVPSVLNVPVCSLRGSSKPVSVFGFRHLFSQPLKDRAGSSSSRTAAPTRAAKAAGGGKKKAETERETERIRARREPSRV